MVEQKWIVDMVPGPRFPAWTRGNAADVFPEPVTPAFVTMYLGPGLGAGLRDAYISFGTLDWDEYEHPNHPELFKVFGGYLYNPLSLTRLFGARTPGLTPEAIDKAFFDDRPDVPPYVAEPWHESERHGEKLVTSMGWAMTATSLPELDVDKAVAERIRDERPDLTTLSYTGVLARARSIVPFIRQAFETGMIVSSLSSIGPGALQAICDGLGDPTLTIRLLAGIDADSAAPSHAMWALASQARESAEVNAAFEAGLDDVVSRLEANNSPDAQSFLAEFAELLRTYGSRGPNEWDVIAQSWEVRPRTALGAIDLMRQSSQAQAPNVRKGAAIAERDRIISDVRATLADDAVALGTFNAALGSAQLFLSGRERYKTNCIMLVGEIRMCLREIGRRMMEAGVIDSIEQIFMLTDAEFDELRHEPDRFRPVIAKRWTQYQSLFDIDPLFVINGHVPMLTDWPRRSRSPVVAATTGTVLVGACGSGGVATGRARVILDASDPSEFEPGDVLIAPQTDPSWTPLFVPASAVVVNVGAMGSHAMIVCRELGIPCVASVQDATMRIADGAMITVDGNAGTVTVH
jgi:rifampicin phosphotransferase